MRTRVTFWCCVAALAALARGAPGAFAGAQPDDTDAPRPVPAEIVKAWRDAGAEPGWMKNVPPKSGTYRFWEPWRKNGEAGAVPAFRFPGRNAAGALAKLPDPGQPFGLDFHCGWYAGVKLKELAGLKNLQALCIGGVQGDAYADLKELAAMKDLRALYLFYLPVTDEQLENLSGLKNLQTLDLASTPVTDAGLKEVARLASLRALNLADTQVTDAGLKELAALKNLRWLNVTEARVTDAGVKELEKQLPGCRIER
jgi:hypothetical protein